MRIRSRSAAIKFPTRKATFTLFGDGQDMGKSRINCLYDGRGVKNGASPVRLTGLSATPRNVFRAHYSPALGAVFALATDGSVYLYHPGNGKYFNKVATLGTDTFFVDEINGADYATHVFSGLNRLRYLGAGVVSGGSHLSFSTGTVFGQRFFGVPSDNPLKLCWSGGDSTSWNAGIGESGYLLLPPEGGRILKLAGYGDKLIAFRESGITIVRALCEPQHIRVENTAEYLGVSGIIPDTCAACNGGIYFCTGDGVYVYDGSSVKSAGVPAEDGLYGFVSASGSGRYYYLICSSPLAGEGYLYRFDTQTCRGCFINYRAKCVVAAGETVYAFTASQVSCLDWEDGGVMNWTTGTLGFGTEGAKSVLSVEARSEGELTLRIMSGIHSRTFPCNGRLKVLMAGTGFVFNVYGRGRLLSLTATVGVRDAN